MATKTEYFHFRDLKYAFYWTTSVMLITDAINESQYIFEWGTETFQERETEF